MEQRTSLLQRTLLNNLKGNLSNIILLAVDLIVSIPILFFININPNRTHWSYVAIYLVFYTIVALLIWRNRQDLTFFHIDRPFVILFLLFGTLFRVVGIDNSITLLFELALFPIAIILGIKLWKGKVQLNPLGKRQFIWMGIAILIGFIFSFLVSVLDPRKNAALSHITNIPYSVGLFLGSFFEQVGTTGIIEEPVYRGFLWGTLRRMEFKEYQVLFIQAFLFWIIHLNMAWDSPHTFWVTLPIFSLLLGLLSWKSRSLIPPLMAHIIYNAFNTALRF